MKKVYLVGCNNADGGFTPSIESYEIAKNCKIVICETPDKVPQSSIDEIVNVLTPVKLIKMEDPIERPLMTRQQKRKQERDKAKHARKR
jgi:hypothetical protein